MNKTESLPFILALFDLLKGIAWPLAVVIIAYKFKSDIPLLLRRLRKAGPTGVELDPVEQQKTVGTTSAISTSIELKLLPGLSRTPAIETVEKQLHTELQRVGEHDRADVLVRLLAQARLEAAFALIYSWIFGSQILGLRRLNAVTKASIEDARAFFDPFRQQYPEVYDQYGFDGWLGFLKAQRLVRQEGQFIEITDFGRDFLLYLTALRLSENKSL